MKSGLNSNWIRVLAGVGFLGFVIGCNSGGTSGGAPTGPLSANPPAQSVPAPDPVPSDSKATYVWLKENLFKAHCDQCHSQPTPKNAGVVTNDYKALLRITKNGILIAPGQPENSLILEEIQTGDMPKKGPRIGDDLIQALRDWIEKGAKETEDSELEES